MAVVSAVREPTPTCTIMAVWTNASLIMYSRKEASTKTEALPSEAAAATAEGQGPSPPVERVSGAWKAESALKCESQINQVMTACSG